jgi:hypothetical protein
MFQVGWPNLRNWKFLGVGTQAHSGHTVAWTYEYKLDRCKRTWIIANAHAYIIGIHMQTCEYRKKNVDHSFCTNREKTRKLRGNQNYGESQLIPVGQFVFSRISWHCFRGTGLIYIKRIPCHFPGQTNWILGENTSKIFLIMLWPWKSANAIRTTFKKLPRIGGCRMWSQFTSLISDGKSQSVPHFSKFRCRNRSI